MSKVEIYQRIQNDWLFSLIFIIDNNPDAVMSNLSGMGLLSTPPQDATRSTLLNDVLSIKDDSKLREVMSVPYINNQTNYTGGLESFFQTKAAGVGLAIINGISVLGSAFFQNRTSVNQSEIAQLEFQTAQTYLQAQESSKIFGIDKTVFSVLIGSVALIIIVAIIVKRKR